MSVATPSGSGASAQTAAATASAQRAMNAQYMANTVQKWVNCVPSGGGTTAPFAAGQNLIFTVPPVNNGWLEGIELTFNLTVAVATTPGTLNAAAPYNVVNEIDVQFNGTQGRIHPYFAATVYPRLRGWLRSQANNLMPSGVGFVDPQISALVRSSTFPAVVGNNSWLFTVKIPLNALHELDAAGLLPIMGEANPVQIVVQCNSALVGVDPLANVLSGAGATTVSGTVKCDALYRDGTTFWSPAKDSISLAGLDTTQWLIDAPIPNLDAGQMSRGPVKTMLEHYYMVACVIDGQSSAKFASSNNFNAIQLAVDGTGQNLLQAFGTGTNVGMERWFETVRHYFGQDLDPGIIPWIFATGYNQENASNRMGTAALNMKPDGWTTIYQGVNLAAVGGVAGISPRIVTWLISSNPLGLSIT